MRNRELHVVIGAGVAGCLSAIGRSRSGYDVVLLERERSRSPGTYPVCTQTSNIVSENHSGAEYPYDPQSAMDCLDGRIANERLFPELIYAGKTYSRIIASRSMMADGDDILGQCRANMQIIRDHYRRRCMEDPGNAVFGDPSEICREVASVGNVKDVAGAFITPQRGMNPTYVATQLEWWLRSSGVEFREGCDVNQVSLLRDGRYQVDFVTADGVADHIVADQVSLCSAAGSFRIARQLNRELQLPKLYLALREILYVDLPDGTDKNFTCLKLEDAYGGMLSPLNEQVAMIYHPPAAHVMNVVMDPASGEFPDAYRRYLEHGHPESELRAQWTLKRLRDFYPELRRSSILGVYLKVAINTLADSRMRRNIGVFSVQPGCTLTVLPKWTMCAVNAQRELALALDASVARHNLDSEEARALLARAATAPQEPAPAWTMRANAVSAAARKHAINMRVPTTLAYPFTTELRPETRHNSTATPWVA